MHGEVSFDGRTEHNPDAAGGSGSDGVPISRGGPYSWLATSWLKLGLWVITGNGLRPSDERGDYVSFVRLPNLYTAMFW